MFKKVNVIMGPGVRNIMLAKTNVWCKGYEGYRVGQQFVFDLIAFCFSRYPFKFEDDLLRRVFTSERRDEYRKLFEESSWVSSEVSLCHAPGGEWIDRSVCVSIYFRRGTLYLGRATVYFKEEDGSARNVVLPTEGGPDAYFNIWDKPEEGQD